MTSDAEAIPFRKTRDVGDVITTTFSYLRQNWRSLGKAMLYIVGPLLVVQLVVSTLYQGQMFDAMDLGSSGPATPEEVLDLYAQLLGPMLLMLPLNLLMVAACVTVVYEHMRLYQAHGPGAVVFEDVWAGVKDAFLATLGTTLGVFFAMLLAFAVVALVGGMLAGGLGAGAGPLGAVLGVLLMLLGFVCVGAYLLVFLMLVFPVRAYEDVGLGGAFGRVRGLLDGAFWRSLGVIFVVMLLHYVLAAAFSMPAAIMGGVWGFNSASAGAAAEMSTVFQVVLVACNVVGTIGNTAAYCIPLAAAGLYYFGLVEEKEHAGLAARVGQVGEGAADEGVAGEPRQRDEPRAAGPPPPEPRVADEPASGDGRGEGARGPKDGGPKDQNGATRWRPREERDAESSAGEDAGNGAGSNAEDAPEDRFRSQ